jgi:hypothetical protein
MVTKFGNVKTDFNSISREMYQKISNYCYSTSWIIMNTSKLLLIAYLHIIPCFLQLFSQSSNDFCRVGWLHHLNQH